MAGIRQDIAKLVAEEGDWPKTLLWYAKAVAALRERKFADRTSWYYLGAIHGCNLSGWKAQGIVDGAGDPPEPSEYAKMFDQCQHAGWYFLPWHRGYVWSFETILGDWIVKNGGPSDWALPYWNYLNADLETSRDIPTMFLEENLPDGTPNALSQALRGPATRLGPQSWIHNDITLDAQEDFHTFTSDSATKAYGGGQTDFAHFASATGAVEANPHNYVHVMVGGPGSVNGWMYDPEFAGLDPIFWMHHCNVDRLWAAWLTSDENVQETGSAWMNGPNIRQFMMPDAAGVLSVFTPEQTLPGGDLAPTYDNLTDGTGISPTRMNKTMAAMTEDTKRKPSVDLLGANTGIFRVSATPVESVIRLDIGGRETAMKNMVLEKSVSRQAPHRVYLNAEGIKGSRPSGVLSVDILGEKDGQDVKLGTESLALFGLAKASDENGPHAGGGMTESIEITKLLRAAGYDLSKGASQLKVRLHNTDHEAGEITVDRLSVYVSD
ncbi:tyrosinase family protein [Litorimonas sp. WD9-15]|uniref:tyrosinase family protein n=1 Tax=Litorimonas sp. WD9-15 TaxID=3418716 RepID=UPI003D07653A